MSGMDEYLAAAYGSPQTKTAAAGEPDAEKVAQGQMFCKLAADNGIDLNKLSDADVQAMWNSFSAKLAAADAAPAAGATKVAEFPPKKEEKEEKKEEKGNPFAKKEEHEKEAAARAEFTAQREWTQKVAEADFLGRHMARSFHAQLQADAGLTPAATGESKEAAASAAFVAMLKEGSKKIAEFPPKKEEKKEEKEEKHEEKEGKKEEHSFPFGKKASSSLDEVAANVALKYATDIGLAAAEIGPKLAAVLVLGAPQSTKLAAVTDFDQAKHVRALELLEAIGLKVDWTA